MLAYSGAEMKLPVALVQLAEALGFDSVWTAEAYGSDATSSLAYLAAVTTRIRLGTSILHMNPNIPIWHGKGTVSNVELTAELMGSRDRAR